MIVVNASVHRRFRWSQTEAIPGVASELWRLSNDFGEHNDAEFLDLLGVALNRWQKDSAVRLKSPRIQPEYYLISVDFDQLHGKADASFFDSLPTNFHLSASTVDRVVEAGESLLKDSSEYQRLLSDLRNSP